MATTTRSRRRPQAQPADSASPSAVPAAEAAAPAAPAARKSAAKPAARKTAQPAARKAAKTVASPAATVPAVAEAALADQPARKKAPAKKAPAKKAAALQAPSTPAPAEAAAPKKAAATKSAAAAKKAAATKKAAAPKKRATAARRAVSEADAAPALAEVVTEAVPQAKVEPVQAIPAPAPAPVVAAEPAPLPPVPAEPVPVPPAPADAPAATPAAASGRNRRSRGRRPAAPVDAQAQATTQAVLAVLAAPDDAAAAAVVQPADAVPSVEADGVAPAPAPVPPPTGPAHSQLAVTPGDLAQITWQPGHACPAPLRQAAQRRLDVLGHLPPADDAALPQLLRLAQEGGHDLRIDDAVWALLAAHRDARHRLSALEAAYPDGPASVALQHLLRAPLPLFQAEGALFAVAAGRALLADERGLGKGVQAIAAAQLWRRHFGVQRVLVLCAPAQRSAWQRAWQRFAGLSPAEVQLVDGGHHQRQAQWSAAAGVRILAPEALQSGAAHLAHWSPDLVIVDEPQQLGLHAADWAALQATPHALVLCGAPLADLPELMDTLMAWLDTARLGPLAALRELQAAGQGGLSLDERDVERLTAALSRGMLQRLRADVADQLPPVVHTERLLALAPGQRQAHDEQAAVLRRGLSAWRASGWCSDSDQWRLAQALRAMQQACHRADPADPASALAEATVQALAGQLADWAGTGAPRVAVLCPTAADQAQLALRLGDWLGGDSPVQLLAPGEPLPAGVDVVLQVGVPWRPRRQPGGPRGDAPAGQQWVYLVAQDSIECGLFDTLAVRLDAPRSPADGGARGYLQGDALAQWLQQLQAAWAAVPQRAA
jgi:hypothetical protein